jgi:3-hydroxyacyl-[acyl-carrier-protein] dehydratase
MLVSENDIVHYIPQRPPMVMVHALKEIGEDYAITELMIREDNVFVEKESLQEPGLIENIAQTAAVHAGYFSKQMQESVKVGYIAAIKNLKIIELPPIGANIETTIEIKNRVLTVIIVEGKVRLNDCVIAEAEVRIFNQE